MRPRVCSPPWSPAALVVAVAFVLPGVTSDDQSSHVRWRDGAIFGVVLLAGAVAALALWSRPWLREARIVRWFGAAIAGATVVGGIVLVAVHGVGSGAVGNGGELHLDQLELPAHVVGAGVARVPAHVFAGTGAGSFKFGEPALPQTYLDETIEPHNLPLQFLAEPASSGSCCSSSRLGSWCGAASVDAVTSSPSQLLPAIIVHSLIDVDWDFVAVAIPAFLAAGAIAARPTARRAARPCSCPRPASRFCLRARSSRRGSGDRWANDA